MTKTGLTLKEVRLRPKTAAQEASDAVSRSAPVKRKAIGAEALAKSARTGQRQGSASCWFLVTPLHRRNGRDKLNGAQRGWLKDLPWQARIGGRTVNV